MRLLYLLVFCLGFLVGFMSAFESWGVPPPPREHAPQLNRKLIEFYKNQH